MRLVYVLLFFTVFFGVLYYFEYQDIATIQYIKKFKSFLEIQSTSHPYGCAFTYVLIYITSVHNVNMTSL